MAIEHIITGAAGWAASVFQPVEREGPPIPDGPVLVVANHPNSLLDPLVIFRVAGRPTRPLAKAPLFEQAFVGTLLRGLGGLPVFRPKDDPSQTHRNDETFAAAIAALDAGDAVQIYPEGQSHSEPAMTPLRTGAARIALRAEAERDWNLELRIVPIGLNYARKTQFRGRTLARVGEAIAIAHYRNAYESDPQAAVRGLTADIAAALESVTLNLGAREDAALIDVAERLYARETGQARWRERDPLRERLPRMQLFARGVAWLRTHDPQRHQRLARDVRRYGRYARLFGAAEGDVPPAYSFWPTLRYVIVETAVLLLGLPLATIGSVLWYPAWIAPKYSLKLIRPGHDAIATYKLATGFVAVPATLLVVFGVTAWLAGLRWAAAATMLAVVLGFLTIGWRERWQRVREDSLLFLRVLTRSRERALLAEQRAALVAEFESVAALLDDASSTTGARKMDRAALPAYIRG